jgi:M6 family metalloprotease-like protein
LTKTARFESLQRFIQSQANPMNNRSMLPRIQNTLLRLTGAFAVTLISLNTFATPGAAVAPAGNLPPIDPQKVLDQDDMTWSDYHPIPGVNWADSSHAPSQRTIRIALVLADFDDQPFVITQPKGSDLFGNPQMDPIPREQVAKFYADFWNKPQAINHGHTVNEYWLELSHGRIGVSFDAYGPYHMPKKMIDYPEAAGGGVGNRRGGGRGAAGGGEATGAGSREGGDAATNLNTITNTDLTNTPTARGGGRGGGRGGSSLSGDVDAMWRKDSDGKQYDLVLRVFAGYDETCVWQEFGEMKFQTKEDITPEWGNPDPTQPRWSRSRYVEWTSWKAASYLWSNSAIINGECSGSIRHEISHAAFRIGDNNNNPYVTPYRRCYAGPWDVMDRGSFNGPGGPHNRWEIPVTQGGSMPAGLMLRQQINFGFVTNSNILRLNRDGLAKSGLAVTTITAREVDPGLTSLVGVVVRLDGEAPQDRTPRDDPATNPLSSGNPNYNFYTLEVVQRIGYDSFCPDSGVLLAKNKDVASAVGGPNSFSCFNWTIDAHPEDINKLDFKRPNGEPVMRTIADYRQLNDSLFHAGLDSGSQYEWEDAPNRLHFYMIDIHKDSKGVLSYTVGLRSLDGAGPQKRGVSVTAPGNMNVTAAGANCVFKLKNTGSKKDTDASLHPQDARAWLDNDIYRVTATVEGQGWSAQLLNGLSAVKFGNTSEIPVHATHAAGASATARITLKAVSESDPKKSATATCRVSAR